MLKPSLVPGLRCAKTTIVDLRRKLKETGELESLTADQVLQKAVELLGATLDRVKTLS